MSDEGYGGLTFRPLGGEPEPPPQPPPAAPPAARPARALRRLRWDQVAALGYLLFVAAALGCRPGTVAELGRAATMSLLAERGLPNAEPAARVAAWQQLRRYRPEDDRYQGAVAWQLYLACQSAGSSDAAAVLQELLVHGWTDRAGPGRAVVLGLFALQQGSPELAVPQLEAALRRSDGHSDLDFELRNALSTAYDGLGRREEAEQLLLGLVDAYPDDPMPYNNLGYHYAEHGDNLDEAERLVRRALAMEQQQALLGLGLFGARHRETRATYLDSLGWVHYKRGSLDQAKEELSEAVKLTDDDPNAEILYHLAQVHFDRGADLTAMQLVTKALKVDPSYEPALRLQQQIDGSGRLDGPIT